MDACLKRGPRHLPNQDIALPLPKPLEATLIVAICFGWFIASSIAAVASGFPASSETFSDGSLVGLILIELALGAIALAVLRFRGYALADLLPTPTWQGCAIGVLLFIVTTLAWGAVAQCFPADAFAHQPIADMVSGKRVTLPVVIALSMVNGLYEETFLLGYLMRGFRAAGPSLAIGLSVLVRVMYHLYQGPLGAVSVLVYGLVVGLFYWRTGKLWPAVFAHTLADALALA